MVASTKGTNHNDLTYWKQSEFYLPDFVERLFNLAKEFPLWTSATIPFDTLHASSSCVEGYFNDPKTRVLKNTPPPLRVDKCIKIHICDIYTWSNITFLFKNNYLQPENSRIERYTNEKCHYN